MELTFKFLNQNDINRLSKEEKLDYYKKLRAYTVNEPISKEYVLSKKRIHPFLVVLMKVQRIFTSTRRITVIHDDSFWSRLKDYFSKMLKKDTVEERPIIFNITHIGKFDIETIGEVIKKNFVLLSGDQENLIGTTGGKFLDINGVIYFDMKDPEDRKNAQIQATKTLKSGLNMMWCGEGTWNFTKNLLARRIFPGFVWTALDTNAVIVNVAINQVGQHFTIKVGKTFDPKKHINSKLSKKENVYEIKKMFENEMWSLMWAVFEKEGTVSRKNVSEEQFESYIDARLSEWPGFTREIVEEKKFVDKSITEPEDVPGYFYKYEPKILNPLSEYSENSEKEPGKTKDKQKEITRLAA